MSERFKEPVLKTGDGATHRGFESHSLRHILYLYLEKSISPTQCKPLFAVVAEVCRKMVGGNEKRIRLDTGPLPKW